MHIRVRVPSEEHHPTCCILSPRPAFLNGRGACESTTASCPSLNNDNANAPRGPSRRCKVSLIQPRRMACSVAVRRRKYYSAPRVQRAKDARFLRRRGRNLLPLPTLFDPSSRISKQRAARTSGDRPRTHALRQHRIPSQHSRPKFECPRKGDWEKFQRLANAMPRPATPCHTMPCQGRATAASTPSGAPERGPRTSTPQGETAKKRLVRRQG